MTDSLGASRPAVPLAARLRERLRFGELGPVPVLVGLVIIAIVFQSLNANFLTPRNLSNLILQIGVVGTVACGVVLALLLGEIDLSIGAVAGVAASVPPSA
jgi:D-xylose transport system permease protein